MRKQIEVTDALYSALEEILGLEEEEMRLDPDLDLLENKLIDSLSIVTLLSYVETLVGFRINLKDMRPEDFTTVNALSAAISSQRPPYRKC
jgi:acyl carrier protein